MFTMKKPRPCKGGDSAPLARLCRAGGRLLVQHRDEGCVPETEGLVIDAKDKHGTHYTQLLGLAWVKAGVGLRFACMNLKKMANWAWKSPLFFPFRCMIGQLYSFFGKYTNWEALLNAVIPGLSSVWSPHRHFHEVMYN